MRTYILRRIVHMVPVLLGVVTVVFLALRMIPGDPAIALAGEKASAEQIERMREELGLNRPLAVQYVEFVSNMLTLHLGRSIRTGGAISQELAENFAPTIELSMAALLIAIVIGLPAGILAAVRRGTLLEFQMMLGSLFGVSMPVFWIGLMLIYWVGYKAALFPLSGVISTTMQVPAVTYLYTVDSLISGRFDAFKDVVSHLV